MLSLIVQQFTAIDTRLNRIEDSSTPKRNFKERQTKQGLMEVEENTKELNLQTQIKSFQLQKKLKFTKEASYNNFIFHLI